MDVSSQAWTSPLMLDDSRLLMIRRYTQMPGSLDENLCANHPRAYPDKIRPLYDKKYLPSAAVREIFSQRDEES
jgi:hypothetical protein